MRRQDILNAIEALVKLRTGLKSEIDPDALFKDDLEIDSLLVVDIIIDIEKKFEISLPEEDLQRLSSLNAAADVVERLVGQSMVDGGGAEEESQARPFSRIRDLRQPGH
jgi:acyl carrier protein